MAKLKLSRLWREWRWKIVYLLFTMYVIWGFTNQYHNRGNIVRADISRQKYATQAVTVWDPTKDASSKEEERADTINHDSPPPPLDDSPNEDEVHVLTYCSGSVESRDVADMFKSLLFHRSSAFHLHLVSDAKCGYILTKLLQTWTLPKVKFSNYTANIVPVTKRTIEWKVQIAHKLADTIPKVIVISPSGRLLQNVLKLWKEWDSGYQGHIGAYSYMRNSSATTQDQLILLSIADIREQEKTKTGKLSVSAIPPSWSPPSDLAHCGEWNSVKLYHDKAAQCPGVDVALERAKETVYEIMALNGELLRHGTQICCGDEPETTPTNSTKEVCALFTQAALMPKRTHLHFIDMNDAPRQIERNDVTLLTQFTVDRMDMFEKMVKAWQGPIHAVIYLTDAATPFLLAWAKQNKNEIKKYDVKIHVVYKRTQFYPINYLRNVAMNISVTPYSFFVDIDLIPVPGLCSKLKAKLASRKESAKEALVIPAFQAFETLTTIPKDRNALLQLMTEDKADGYRMRKGWNLGHKPTNYTQWRIAKEPYVVKWRNAFEPYVVLPTATMPLYREVLLERQSDKISYGRLIYALGYTYVVLHDAFVIHLPHPLSKGTRQAFHYPGYTKCAVILEREYFKYLREAHPDKKF